MSCTNCDDPYGAANELEWQLQQAADAARDELRWSNLCSSWWALGMAALNAERAYVALQLLANEKVTVGLEGNRERDNLRFQNLELKMKLAALGGGS